MRCVFVLDIFNGAVVHAIRGKRSKYECIEKFSHVVSTSDPIKVVDAMKPREVYVADLNRLTGSGNNIRIIKQISRKSETMADIGISSLKDLQMLPSCIKPVLGTETASFEILKRAAGLRQINVSLDMKRKKILTRDPELMISPFDVIRKLNNLNLETLIILELDRVGTSIGIDDGFLSQCAHLSRHPVFLGGGVKDAEDLCMLEQLGLKGALVATAVHNGSIPLNLIRG
ncbi:MAG: HisA/HisF-related TIM barrel protein [Methanotrichaceae archaeon]|nr:HisA/HisF-related TIM barrel protein [Methanotrichaceae archaeon]